MNVVGIIVEYNPFHNGHVYHIEQAKKITNADVLVAVMSGNYVQRGTPALFDKWTRANEALKNGVDIVFELPFSTAVQPGHIFANEAVNLLNAVGVNTIVCGAEHPEYDFMHLATYKMDNKLAFKQYKQTYATNYYEQLKLASGIDINSPNDVLALSYAKAIIDNKFTNELNLKTIKRITANYHDKNLLINKSIASASAIREHLLEDLSNYVPHQTNLDLKNAKKTLDFKEWWPFLKYQIESASLDDLSNIYQVTEGLEYKLKANIKNANNLDQFLTEIKSKRYTASRIQRMLLYILLNVTDAEMKLALKKPFLNLLGTTKNGQNWLKAAKKDIQIPIFSKIGKAEQKNEFALQYKVDTLFSYLGQQKEQNIGCIPWHD